MHPHFVVVPPRFELSRAPRCKGCDDHSDWHGDGNARRVTCERRVDMCHSADSTRREDESANGSVVDRLGKRLQLGVLLGRLSRREELLFTRSVPVES